MRCYFKLLGSDQTVTDEEGHEVADMEEARTFAREAGREMAQDGVAEIAHWRGWQMEARDASGTVLGGFKWSSQHRFCRSTAATRQALLQAFSSRASFVAWR